MLPDALSVLSRFRQDVVTAERRGRSPRHLLDRAGTLVSQLQNAGADDRAIAEARQLYERAMKLPIEVD